MTKLAINANLKSNTHLVSIVEISTINRFEIVRRIIHFIYANRSTARLTLDLSAVGFSLPHYLRATMINSRSVDGNV